MIDSTVFFLRIVFALQISFFVVNGFVKNARNDVITVSELPMETNIQNRIVHQTTIRHYARHGLCRNFNGKRLLYNAMKVKFCDVSLSMIHDLVMDLCRHKNYMLDKWVKELFDMDGDGYISHFEKHYYT